MYYLHVVIYCLHYMALYPWYEKVMSFMSISIKSVTCLKGINMFLISYYNTVTKRRTDMLSETW